MRFASLIFLVFLIPLLNCALIQSDLDALRAVYNSFTSTNINWDFSKDLCTQNGITCTGSRITRIDISNGETQGTLSPQIGKLTGLKYFFAFQNQISGSIPTQLAQISELIILELQNNEFTGSIPIQFGNLAHLETLSLSNNNLNGNIPAQLGNLLGLTSLSLSHNKLSGTIPTQLGKLTKLTSFFLRNNQLSGPIPTELGGLSELKSFDVSTNKLSGTIPTELQNYARLEDLYLDNNELSGPIPPRLGAFYGIVLSNNNLSGTIPPEITNRGLYLYLDHNQLTGTIPTEFGGVWIYVLNLGYNQLTGTIPTEIGKLIPYENSPGGFSSQLETLHLNDNQLTGTIPTEFATMEVLFGLYLQNNRLSGPIPSRLSKLDLSVLHLSNNQLTGTIPSSLKKSPFVELFLASNFFECPIFNYTDYPSVKSDYNLANDQCSNDCPPNKCSNGRTCSISGDSYDSFSCACRPGMSGSNCEISACDSFNCENGGVCFLTTLGVPRCKCLPGFQGNRCQKDLCFPNPCQNGGSGCSHNSLGYGCTNCPYPYGGTFCQYNFNSEDVVAYYPFSSRNKLMDEAGNGYNLSSFNAESMSYPHVKDPIKFPYSNYPMNEALVLFGQDIISTSSQRITLPENDFSFSIVFSISKFYLTTNLIFFTPNDLSDISSMSLNVLPTGALQVTVKGSPIFSSPPSTISLNTLNALTFTKKKNLWRIFMNDDQVASTTSSVAINIANNKMFLGYNFRGILDEVVIYPFALSNDNAKDAYWEFIPSVSTSCGGCKNGGICGKLEIGKTCFCSQCWTGDKCETRIKGCLRPCKNGGTYVDGVCHCAAGYFGSQCESIQTCPAITSSKGNFPQANAYQIVTGTCSSGNGNPKRQCLHDGTWQAITNPCT